MPRIDHYTKKELKQVCNTLLKMYCELLQEHMADSGIKISLEKKVKNASKTKKK